MCQKIVSSGNKVEGENLWTAETGYQCQVNPGIVRQNLRVGFIERVFAGVPPVGAATTTDRFAIGMVERQHAERTEAWQPDPEKRLVARAQGPPDRRSLPGQLRNHRGGHAFNLAGVIPAIPHRRIANSR